MSDSIYKIEGPRNGDERLYWSNLDGWGGFDGATKFSEAEIFTIDMPVEAVGVARLDIHGDIEEFLDHDDLAHLKTPPPEGLTFEVEIQSREIKTIRVEGVQTREEAIATAHEMFGGSSHGYYDQDTLGSQLI